MTRLFSYVVDHDLGYAPDPFGGYCSLVQCKFSKTGKRKNIVELAEVSDWILGTGGKGPNTAGNGRIIYIMRVDEKLTLSEHMGGQVLLLAFQGHLLSNLLITE
jgi:hypothetical protein